MNSHTEVITWDRASFRMFSVDIFDVAARFRQDHPDLILHRVLGFGYDKEKNVVWLQADLITRPENWP